jgi:hypothetical protein
MWACGDVAVSTTTTCTGYLWPPDIILMAVRRVNSTGRPNTRKHQDIEELRWQTARGAGRIERGRLRCDPLVGRW